MAKYIYEYPQWPTFNWDELEIQSLLGEVRLNQGKIIGQMNALGFSEKEEANLRSMTLEIVKSSEIEGEELNYEQVRSSIARKLGLNTGGQIASSRHIEGVVEMMLNATQHQQEPLTEERLLGWHAALFPTGYSGPYKIEVAKYRTGEMQIVSGALGKEKVHYEAIKPAFVKQEMDLFLKWFNEENKLDGVLKAAIAHFWFIIIHPFDDGNGRIGRALSEMLLARAEGSGERYYSMSGQIVIERENYYKVLQKVQHSTGNITAWIKWYLQCLKNALLAAQTITSNVLNKANFWKWHENTSINERQRLMINKLFDGFEGKLQTSKWAKITKTSNDTALRDIKDLIEKGILQQTNEGGRNINYELIACPSGIH
jgi:Fic family protein